MGTLEKIPEEAGYLKGKNRLPCPKFIATRRVSLPLPPEHASVELGSTVQAEARTHLACTGYSSVFAN
jgi:hypothetical protein